MEGAVLSAPKNMDTTKNTLDLARLNSSVNASKATLMNMRHSASTNEEQAMRMAANEFAGLFLGQMYKAMSATISRTEMFGGGAGEEVFRDMLNQEYSRQAAYSDSLGMGEIVYNSLKRRNEVNQ